MTRIAITAQRIIDYVKAHEGQTITKVCDDLRISYCQYSATKPKLAGIVKSVRREQQLYCLYLETTPLKLLSPAKKPKSNTAARIARQTPRIILPALHKPRERLALRDIRFEQRTKPLPAHPPIRTTWLPVASWEMAA